MALFQHGHALLIGIADYQDPGLKLRVPITLADARGVAGALRDPKVAAYPDGQVSLLLDAQATRVSVLAALEGFAREVKPEDTAFLFFCGHGVLGEDGLYYFTTQDTALTAGQKARKETGVSAPQLLELLRKVKAERLLFLINACFSGHLSPTLGPADVLGAPPSATLGAEVLDTGEGRVLITASRPSQYSFYKEDQPHTYFGQALIDGLSGKGVAGSGGYVGLYELYLHLHQSVKAAAGGAQEPVLNIVRGVGPFPVALHSGGTAGTLNPSAIQQTPPPGTAVEVVERTVVQAVGRAARAFNIQAGGDVRIDQSRKVIDFGSGNKIGNVSMGDVAGRDLTKVTITTTPAAAGSVDDRQALLGMIDRLRADVAKLTDAPEDERGDVERELSEAHRAGQQGKRPRLLQKLESAQRALLPLAEVSPASVKVAEAVGTLLQRAMTLKG